MDKTSGVSTIQTLEFWRASNRYAILLSLVRRSLSRRSFHRLLEVHRGAAERVACEGFRLQQGREWLQRVELCLEQAYGELEAGAIGRSWLTRLDHHFAHVAAGIGRPTGRQAQSAGSGADGISLRFRR